MAPVPGQVAAAARPGAGPAAELEELLALLCGRRHAIFTAGGTAALYLLFEALEDRPVLLPEVCCYAPAAAALFAGREVRTLEVAERDFTVDPDELPDLRGCLPVAVHTYGHLAAGAALARAAEAAGAPLIEDAAQAFGAGGPGRPVGALGTASVLSFGHSKVLDAGGGGAVLCDDDALAAELRARGARLPVVPEGAAAAGFEALRSDYYRSAARGARGWLRPIVHAHQDVFLRRASPSQAARVLARLPELEPAVLRRREIAAYYGAWLRGTPGVTLPEPRPGSVPWRYSLLCGERRDEVVLALRRAGLHASTWYPALGDLLDLEAASPAPVAERVAAEVVNLWTDPAQVDHAAAQAAVRVVREVLQR